MTVLLLQPHHMRWQCVLLASMWWPAPPANALSAVRRLHITIGSWSRAGLGSNSNGRIRSSRLATEASWCCRGPAGAVNDADCHCCCCCCCCCFCSTSCSSACSGRPAIQLKQAMAPVSPHASTAITHVHHQLLHQQRCLHRLCLHHYQDC
jgi:hypothetical protein